MQSGVLVVLVADCLTFKSSKVPKQREQRTWQRLFVWGQTIWFVLAHVSEKQSVIIIPELFFKNKSIYRDQYVDWTPKHYEPASKTGYNGQGCPFLASAGQKQLLFHSFKRTKGQKWDVQICAKQRKT